MIMTLTPVYFGNKIDWILAGRAEEDLHFHLCAVKSYYNIELKISPFARANFRERRIDQQISTMTVNLLLILVFMLTCKLSNMFAK